MMTSHPVVVALLSDLHLHKQECILANLFNAKFQQVVKDLRGHIQPDGPDYWVINGDICDHGTVDELKAFEAIFPTELRERLLVTTGNHEFLREPKALIDEWKQYFQVTTLYTSYDIFDRKDMPVHIVLLANEYRSDGGDAQCWMSPDQLDWFSEDLEENRNKDTVVFMHQPLHDTVTPANSGKLLCRNQEERLREIVSKHSRVRLWFSGHTHCRLGPGETLWTAGGVTYLGLGAIGYLTSPDHGVDETLLRDSHYRVLEIYPDKFTVKARHLICGSENSISGEWIDNLEVSVKRR